MLSFPDCRATAKVSVTALTENFSQLRAYARSYRADVRQIAVVKANAYGHGTALAVTAFLDAGCDFFAVATLGEALEVRAFAPRADVLILGYTPPTQAATLAASELTQTVFSAAYAEALSKGAAYADACVRIHIKIDGGMCRLGFSPSDTDAVLSAARLPHLDPVGLYTHFPVADTDKAATRCALSRFLHCKQALAARGLPLFSHAAASAAMLTLPESILDGVRPGLALYGVPPAPTALPLRTALTLTAPVVQIREVAAGTPIGYGGAFVTSRPSRIGTVPLGYGDGIPRAFGTQAVRVFHKDVPFFAPIAGRICMDQTMLDLTDTAAEVGDRVIFFDDPRQPAAATGTIPYEILTALSSRIGRVKA